MTLRPERLKDLGRDPLDCPEVWRELRLAQSVLSKQPSAVG
jgi:hypothetical protein